MSVSSRPSLSSFTQSEDYKHLRSRSEELTHREDDCHLHDFDSSHLTPRKIKSTVCLNKPTHPGDDCHPHAFQLIPLPNSRNTKSLKLLLLGTYSTQRRFRLYTFQFLSPNSRFTNSNQGEELLDTPFRLLSVLDVSTLLYLPLCTPNRRLQTLFTTSPPTVIIHNSPYRISTILVTLHHEADEY
jgi:hypothetical protein